MGISGKYCCPHCNAPLSNELAGWEEVKYEFCPACGKSHIIPPVNLRSSERREGLAQLAVCPVCLGYDNYQCSPDSRTARCKQCSAEVLLDDFDAQIRFADQCYDAIAKGTAPASVPDFNRGVRAVSAGKVCASPIGTPLLGKSYQLSLILNNPFWLLEVPSGTDRNEVIRSREKLLQRLNRPQYRCDPAVRLGESTYYSRDAEELKKRLKLLDSRQEYLIASLFWIDSGAAPLSADCLFQLTGGDAADAPLQSRAAAQLVVAVAMELDYLSGAIAAPPEKEWELALRRWNELLADKAFFEQLQSRVQGLTGLPENSARTLVAREIPDFLLGVIDGFINEYTAAGRIEDVRRLILIGNDNPFSSDLSNRWLVRTLGNLTRVKLDALVTRAKANFERDDANPKWVDHQAFAARFDAVLSEAEDIVVFLREKLLLGDALTHSLHFDDLALAILEEIEKLDCPRDKPDYVRNQFQAVITLKRAGELPLSRSVCIELENRAKEKMQDLYPFSGEKMESPGKCWFIPGEWASASASLVFEVNKIISIEITGAYQYQTKQVIVPRSRLAEDIHNGLKEKEILKRHPASPALRRQLSENAQGRRKKFAERCRAIEKLLPGLNSKIAESGIDTSRRYPDREALRNLKEDRNQKLNSSEGKKEEKLAEHAAKWNRGSLWKWSVRAVLPTSGAVFAGPFFWMASPGLPLLLGGAVISGAIAHLTAWKIWSETRNARKSNILAEYEKEKKTVQEDYLRRKEHLFKPFNQAHRDYADFLADWKRRLDAEFSGAAGAGPETLAKTQSQAKLSPYYRMFKGEGYADGKEPAPAIVNRALESRIRNATREDMIMLMRKIGQNSAVISFLDDSAINQLKDSLIAAMCK